MALYDDEEKGSMGGEVAEEGVDDVVGKEEDEKESSLDLGDIEEKDWA